MDGGAGPRAAARGRLEARTAATSGADMGSREELAQRGFTVARGIIPPQLVAKLLAACDAARAIARREIGPQAQRLQPVVWRDDLDQSAFEEYARLPAMVEAVSRIFSPQHRHAQRWYANAPLGCLFEPAAEAWCTNGHRDWRDNYSASHDDRLVVDGPRQKMLAEWYAGFHDSTLFNQINCALLPEGCLWVVPVRPGQPTQSPMIHTEPARPLSPRRSDCRLHMARGRAPDRRTPRRRGPGFQTLPTRSLPRISLNCRVSPGWLPASSTREACRGRCR